MTALCGGATSSVKPGSPILVNVGLGLITAGIAELAPYLLPIAILVDAFVWNANVNCVTDPPPMPTFTADDLEVVALGLLSGHAGVTIQKIQDLTTNIVWRQTCQCDAGPQPPPPPPPMRTDNTGGAYTSSPGACFVGSWEGTPSYDATTPRNQFMDITQYVLPMLPGPTVPCVSAGLTYQAHPVPRNMTSVKWTGQRAISSGNPTSQLIPGVQFEFWDAAQAHTDSFNFTTNSQPAGPFSQERTLATTNAYAWVGAGYGDPTPPNTLQGITAINNQVFCGGNTSTTAESCCPPDPSIMFALNQLIQLISNLHFDQVPPKPYVDGLRHANLSGAGTIGIAATSRAIRLEVRTSLGQWPNNPGDPNYYFSLGFITPFAVGTPLKGQRLVYDRQTFSWPSYTDQIGYTLYPGVIVDLVELA